MQIILKGHLLLDLLPLPAPTPHKLPKRHHPPPIHYGIHRTVQHDTHIVRQHPQVPHQEVRPEVVVVELLDHLDGDCLGVDREDPRDVEDVVDEDWYVAEYVD